MCIQALLRRCLAHGVPLPMACSGISPLAQPQGADEAAALMRGFYFGLDCEEAVFQGRRLIDQHPGSSPLRAWMLLNLA